MNKKKYLVIVAIAIFSLLAVFTFANPFEKEEPNENRVLEEIEQEDLEKEKEKDEVKEVITIPYYPIYNNHGVEQKPQIEVDNSYELALKAVEEIEETLDVDSLTKATELVGKVKDEDKKEELEKRIEKVKEIIELINDVDTLVNNIIDASTQQELEEIREYVSKSDIGERIEDLSNETIKSSLIEKINSVLTKLNDTSAPEINIEDGAILNSDTKITITDDSEVIIKLNDKEIENDTVVSDGNYVLTVTDKSFNTLTIEFMVDTIAPEFVVGEGSVGTGEYYSTLYLTVKDSNIKYLDMNNAQTELTEDYEFASEFYIKGKNVITVTDIAGNKSTFTFEYVNNVTVLEENAILESTEKLEIAEDEIYVLDLNGNIYTVENLNAARNIVNRGTLIIKNGKMLNSATGVNYGLIDNYGTLLIDGVEFIDNAAGDGSTVKNRSGKITIKNSSFKNTGIVNGNASIYSEGELVVENTTFESASTRAYPLIINSGNATINNVTVNGTHGALCINAGTVVVENFEYEALVHYGVFITNNGGVTGTEETNVTINGGTFKGNLYGIEASVDDGNQDRANVNIIINDGTFEGNNGAMAIAKKATTHEWNITINGGTFNGIIDNGAMANWNLSINGGKFTSSVISNLTDEYEEILNEEYYEVIKKDE